jgi:hypothetical protein
VRDRPPRLSVALLGACVVVTSLMLLVPSVSAAGPSSSSKVYAAPFSGAPLLQRVVISQACGSAALSHGPTFNLSSGVGRIEAVAGSNSSVSCRTTVLPSEGEASGFLGWVTPNFTSVAGSHSVKAVWDLHWSIDISAKGAGSHPANVGTAAEIVVEVEILDIANNYDVGDHEWTKVVNRTGDASVHSVGSQTLNLSAAGVFNSTRVYEVITAVQVIAVGLVTAGATSGQCSVSVNLATNGNKATLVSVTRP